MKGIVIRKDKILPSSAVAGCLDVLCKAYAQIAPVDANLAVQINEAIETIMEACNSMDRREQGPELRSYPEERQPKKPRTDIIEDIFTGEILYRGLK